MTLGEIIRKNRKKAGLSQKQLGLLCGYIPTSAERVVQYWEKDAREPSVKVLRKLADALGLTLDQLIPEDDEEDDQL